MDFDFAPDLPGFSKVIVVKGAKAADGLVECGAGELAIVLEVGEEGEDLAAVEIRQGGVRIVVGKLGGPAKVGLYGSPAQAFELDEGAVIVKPRCGCECVCFFS